MKPLGPIPAGFSTKGSELVIGGRTVSAILDQAGSSPAYVYDFALVAEKIALFRRQFAPVKLHYAIKANPFAPLLKAIAPLVDGFDVASAREITLALEAGMAPEHISFAGPGKRDSDIAYALQCGVTVNCESFHQIERAIALGDALNLRPRLAVRVNPDFEIKGSGMRMGGGAKQFGIDAEHAAAACQQIVRSGAVWQGLHIFSGSQALDADALIEAQRATLALAHDIITTVSERPALLNMGGGLGIPYFHKDTPLDTARVAEHLVVAIEQSSRLPLAAKAHALELGRWLVGEAGVYLTTVIETKTSRGEHFAITDGGMHHHLAASGNFGQVVRRNYPVAVANRMASMADETEASDAMQVTHVVGCLCTPLDKIADSAWLPRLETGDIIAVFASGAYGFTASPHAFLHQEPATEILLNG